MAHTFWRIVRGQVATLDDFKSGKQLGKPLRDPRMEREWVSGISVFDSFEHAAERARAVHLRLGAWVIRLSIPETSSIEWAQTGMDARHFTIYASPAEALSLVDDAAIFVGGGSHGN